ncbi:MAG: phcB, partial [Verrucomicrobiaceae bacterium]|nr:phcB [Verrucomicrobiaceae bacterium]
KSLKIAMNTIAQIPTILVVADDLKLVESLRGAFGSSCQVYLSPSVSTGLKRVENDNLCAVLLNLGMRGLEAPEVVAEIRRARGDIPILGFVPTPQQPEFQAATFATVIDGCRMVQMPVGWRELRQLLEEHVPTAHGPAHPASPTSTPTSLVPMMPSPLASMPATPGSLSRGPSLPPPPLTGEEGQAISTIIPFPLADGTPAVTADDGDVPLERSIAATFLRDGALQMEHANRFEATTTDGQRISGDIMRVSPHFVVCEVLNPLQVLMPGWRTKEATVTLAREQAYHGPARLSKAMNTGRSLICEWTLEGPWKAQPSPMLSGRISQEQVLGPFLGRMRILQRISQVFKSVVAEVASLLDEAKQGLDRIEISLQSQPDESRNILMRALMPQLFEGMGPAINEVFERFERASDGIPPELDAEYHSLVRQHLHPYMMCSPFIHHIYSKPLGYAGDYGALQKLLGDPFEGHTLFAKVLNAWLVLNPAGEAYRTRLKTILEALHDQAERCHERSAEFRVLSIGCGAANEVVRFAANDDLCNNTAFTLVDFSSDTLAFAKKNVEDAMREHWRLMRASYVKMSVQGLILDEARMQRKGVPSHGPVAKAGGYDFIYCTGLYDYFSDRVTRRLTQSMYNMLAPGGRLLVCNFTPANPIRHFMKYVLDWDLKHRTPEQLLSLAPAGSKADQLRITMSPGDVEAYLHVTKPL